jgi:hypothetical protein
MARTKGISGLSISMIGVGALLVRSAITGKNPIEEARALLTGKKPEPLSTAPRGTPLSSPAYTPTPAGGAGKVTSAAGLKPHVAAAASSIANKYGIEVQGFAARNIEGTNTLSDHALGLALDAMTSNLVTGNAIVAEYKNHPQIKYIIWQGEIWSPGKGTRGYTGVNRHTNHVHLSFYDTFRGRIGR